jgi:hypothetical protein
MEKYPELKRKRENQKPNNNNKQKPLLKYGFRKHNF